MSNQEYTPAPVQSRRSLLPLIIVLVIVVAAIVVAMTFLRKGPGTWDAAAFLPKEVVAAVTLDLSKSKDRTQAMDYIRDIFKAAGVEDPEKEIFTPINTELGIDVKQDILAKANGRAAIAVLTQLTGMTPGVVAVIGANSDDAARKLASLIKEKLDQHRLIAKAETYEGYDYYSVILGGGGGMGSGMGMGGPQIKLCVGSVRNALVCALGNKGFESVVDTVKSGASLARNDEFAKLRQTGDSKISTFYYSGPGLWKLIEPFASIAFAASGPDVAQNMEKSIKSTIAVVANASADANGLKIDIKGISAEEGPSIQEVSLDQLASSAPRDAAFALATGDLTTAWTMLKKQLATNPTLQQQMGPARAQVKQALGIDLLEDALYRLKTFNVYYAPKPLAPGGEFPGYIALTANIDNPNVVRETLKKINAVAAASGKAKTSETTIGSDKVTILTDTTPQPGKVRFYECVSGNLLVVVLSENQSSVPEALAVARGKGDKLVSAGGFQTTKTYLPAKGQELIYFDAVPLANVLKSKMTPKDRQQMDAVLSRVSMIGMSVTQNGAQFQASSVIPFKKK